MKKAFKKCYGYQWLMALLLGLGLPFVGKQLGWREINQVIWLYLIINSLYTLYLGYEVRRRGYSPFILVLVPTIFSIVTTLWLNLVPIQYGIYFGLLYVVLSLFTFFGDTRDDPDENLIPVENGFHVVETSVDKEFPISVDGGFRS